ncbi:hypothetical protein AC249_AIPGENE13546 [Exaiptasia diaphana]|nr:hypothetical protein AC249_AIPGENE13546 [Exaiptasia diaphana]
MAAKRRQYMQEMLLMLTEDQSSDSSECDSSDDDDDVELLLLETMFVERNIGARINPADISDEDFENFFSGFHSRKRDEHISISLSILYGKNQQSVAS